MPNNFTQGKSLIKNSVKIVLCILLLMVSLTATPVSAVAPVASFVGIPTNGSAPLTVLFTDLSSNSPTGWAWYFGDETYTAPWTQMTASAGWSTRHAHTSVAMPDGSIVLMGGYDNIIGDKNDVWRSADKGATWTQMTASAGWAARDSQTSVVMPDGSIVLMGGGNTVTYFNDVWRSTDNGATWTQMTASAGWSARGCHSSVAMPDGSIILMGGQDSGGYKNDVWRSTDNGVTWTQITASSGWSARHAQTSVVMPDNSIILMGGQDSGGYKNDVWQSTNNGATWTQMTASAGWSVRSYQTTMMMPDGSIILMGGYNGGYNNDVWRSTDNGATWRQITASAGWSARAWHSSVMISDSSIVLMGGFDSSGSYKNDVWRFESAGSTVQNPSHTYTPTGVYQVALQAFNAAGYNRTQKTGYITVTAISLPVANFLGTPTTGTAPLMVTFTDLSTNTPTLWNWSFGDGSSVNSTVKNPVHSYASAGNYPVSLTVTNAAGSDTKTVANYITVSSGVVAPVASFVGTPTSGIAPLTVTFTDGSTNTPTGWAWFFGDETYTASWTQQTPSAGWLARGWQSSVAMPDGSIVLMGGWYNDINLNDVWRSVDNGATWMQQNASAGWSTRHAQSSVAMPDGSIVLTGGYSGSSGKNDTWRSTDNGATWTRVSASSGWMPRGYHSSVAMPDGSIVLMGGLFDGSYKNDTWRSPDNGATWTQMSASSGWSVRSSHTSVAMPDSSIILMGGWDGSNVKNDTWRSTDNGATWTQVNASSGWSARSGHSSVAMPDGSVVLMGGLDGVFFNDVWRSTDNGATWTQVTASSGWSPRKSYSSVAMPDGSIVLMGGYIGANMNKNDTWRLIPSGSSVKNPSHTYTSAGIYQVALQAFNTAGYNSMRKSGYITVTAISPPVANFLGTPTTGTAPLTVTFTDLSTNTPIAWNWSFGDGSSVNSTVKNPVHSYANAGNYSVSLTVTNAAGSDTKMVSNYITVSSGVVAPVANFLGTPTTGTAPLTVTFTDISTNTPAAWNWSFGDGSSVNSTVKNPVHSYASAGNYSVSLTVTNAAGSDTKTVANYITVSSGEPAPVANFLGTPTTGTAPLTVTFTDLSTNTPTAWSWSFGDGSSVNSTVKNPVHSYASAGNYSVSLTVTNAAGSDTKTVASYITVSSGVLSPVANFLCTPTTGTAPLTVTFTDLSTNTPTAWSWSFGDGSSVNSTVKNPVHSYASAGNYSVSLTVTNAAGSDTKTVASYITVSSGVLSPVANFLGTPTTGTAPLTITFTDTSLNTPTAWNWSFGDGSRSSVQNPSHTYNSTGTYTVSLNAANAYGSDTKTLINYITVILPGPPVANFIGTPTSGTAPLIVNFVDNSVNFPTSWMWNFGDGSESPVQNPTHIYTATGTYTVSLKATNAYGSDTKNQSNYISVYPPEEPGGGGSDDPAPVVQPVVPPVQPPVIPVQRPLVIPPNVPAGAPVDVFASYPMGFEGLSYNDAGDGALSIDLDAAGKAGAIVVPYNNRVEVYQHSSPGVLITFWGGFDTSSRMITGKVNRAEFVTDPLALNVPFGNVTGSVRAELPELTQRVYINNTISNVADATVTGQFVQIMSQNNLSLDSIAFTMKLQRVNLINGPANVTLTIPLLWVDQHGGIDAVRITRISDTTGKTELLTTVYTGTDPNGNIVFRGDSPNGTSIFGLVTAKATVLEKQAHPNETIIPQSRPAMITNVGMFSWLLGIISDNPVLIVILIAVLAVAVYFGWWKRRL